MRTVRVFFVVLAMVIICSAGGAFAANGVIKGSFVYKDPNTAAETVLTDGYVYLHSAVKGPPMEKFLSKADFVLATGAATPFSLSVAPGSYYIRVLQRQTASNGPFGPPLAGDYTWIKQAPITVVSGGTLDLGKIYAVPFAASPVTITGTVTSASGTPMQGWYVRAQNEPCLPPICTDGVCQQTGNQCGAVKYLALKTTDTGGSYTLMLADPGTYYLYSSPCLMRGHNLFDDDRCKYNAAAGAPITVKRGDSKIVNITVP